MCEGALGLSILVSIIPGYGRDFLGLIEYCNVKIIIVYSFLIPLCFSKKHW